MQRGWRLREAGHRLKAATCAQAECRGQFRCRATAGLPGKCRAGEVLNSGDDGGHGGNSCGNEDDRTNGCLVSPALAQQHRHAENHQDQRSAGCHGNRIAAGAYPQVAPPPPAASGKKRNAARDRGGAIDQPFARPLESRLRLLRVGRPRIRFEIACSHTPVSTIRVRGILSDFSFLRPEVSGFWQRHAVPGSDPS